MDPALAHLALQQMQQQPPRPLSPDELDLLEHIAYLDSQAIVLERMLAGLNRSHGSEVRNNLTPEETAAFLSHWSTEVFDTCLRAGVTTGEFRAALRTGTLPDQGLVESLAAFRNPHSS